MKELINKEIYCLSYFLTKKNYRNQLIEALTKIIEPTLAEPGCLQYELLIDKNNPYFLIMLEKFTDEEALSAHEQQPYIKNFVENEMNEYCESVSWNVAYHACRD